MKHIWGINNVGKDAMPSLHMTRRTKQIAIDTLHVVVLGVGLSLIT